LVLPLKINGFSTWKEPSSWTIPNSSVHEVCRRDYHYLLGDCSGWAGIEQRMSRPLHAFITSAFPFPSARIHRWVSRSGGLCIFGAEDGSPKIQSRTRRNRRTTRCRRARAISGATSQRVPQKACTITSMREGMHVCTHTFCSMSTYTLM